MPTVRPGPGHLKGQAGAASREGLLYSGRAGSLHVRMGRGPSESSMDSSRVGGAESCVKVPGCTPLPCPFLSSTPTEDRWAPTTKALELTALQHFPNSSAPSSKPDTGLGCRWAASDLASWKPLNRKRCPKRKQKERVGGKPPSSAAG